MKKVGQENQILEPGVFSDGLSLLRKNQRKQKKLGEEKLPQVEKVLVKDRLGEVRGYGAEDATQNAQHRPQPGKEKHKAGDLVHQGLPVFPEDDQGQEEESYPDDQINRRNK